MFNDENKNAGIDQSEILVGDELVFVPHAVERIAQRNLKPDEIALVIRYGQLIHRTGVDFIFLGRRDVPPNLAKAASRLIGTTVVFCNHKVRTAYRNRIAVRRIKRKPKANCRKRWELT